MVLIKAVFHSEQRVSQTGGDMVRVAPHFLDAQGHFVFELDPITGPVVDVHIRSFIGASEGIALADEPHINLPMFVSWSIGIVREKGGSALRYHQKARAA